VAGKPLGAQFTMISVDTNILVYAHRKDSEWYTQAFKVLKKLAEGTTNWMIPSHCLIEFYAIVTHPRIYNPPTTPEQANNQIKSWLDSPSLILAHSTKESLRETFKTGAKYKIKGAAIHDLRITMDAAFFGSDQIYSADREIGNYSTIKIINPLVE
jgi:predicted nucleic acid-binding protein